MIKNNKRLITTPPSVFYIGLIAFLITLFTVVFLNDDKNTLYINEVKKNNQLMIDNVKLKQINNTYDSLLRVCMGMKGLKQKQNGSK